MVALTPTIIIPFHRNLAQLRESLPAARRALPDAQILIAADGALDDCRPMAQEYNARVVTIAGPKGPGVARNRAASEATGDVLIFIDTDVVPAPDALDGMLRLLEQEPDVAAVFGAYDHDPGQRNFMSQYKNLSHACVHESGNPEASTFWAGLGAIRTRVFRQVGGFDERFGPPSVEDIDLGYRVRKAGFRVRLDPRFRGKHLKRWTTWNSIVTEVKFRGIPWTQLIHRYGGLSNDLNTKSELRLSVALSYIFIASLMAAAIWPAAALVAVAAIAVLITINRDYYAWFVRHRGWGFTLRVIPAHVLHHLCNGVSFVVGTLVYIGSRLGLTLPGAVPASEWNPAHPRPGSPLHTTD